MMNPDTYNEQTASDRLVFGQPQKETETGIPSFGGNNQEKITFL